jgi:hypothetical protein
VKDEEERSLLHIFFSFDLISMHLMQTHVGKFLPSSNKDIVGQEQSGCQAGISQLLT